MSKLSSSNDPLTSALKEGILIGIVATLRQHQFTVTRQVIANILRQQQGWAEEEIDYFMNWLLIFNIED